MAIVEKLAISLPKEDAAQLDARAKKMKVSRSAIVRNALRYFFERETEDLIREQYARYYSDEKLADEDAVIARKTWNLSRKTWPEK